MKNFCLQLFSVKNALEEDFDATLKAVADMGYDGVEFAGKYGGYSGEELKERLEYYGLTPVAAHLSLEDFENNFEYHAEILKGAGCRTLICPWIDIETYEEAEELGKKFEKIAEKCLMNGFEFGFHNHWRELNKPDGETTLMEVMLEVCDPLVLCEFDLGWIKVAGLEPEYFIRKYAGKINYLHFKQFDENRKDTTLEKGIIDYKHIVKLAEKMGCEYFIVEQEGIEGSELEAAKKNIEFLKSI